MARIVTDIIRTKRPGSRTSYPWTRWFDGQQWLLERGKDFKCSVSSFRDIAYRHAKRLGVPVSILICEDDPEQVLVRPRVEPKH